MQISKLSIRFSTRTLSRASFSKTQDYIDRVEASTASNFGPYPIVIDQGIT